MFAKSNISCSIGSPTMLNGLRDNKVQRAFNRNNFFLINIICHFFHIIWAIWENNHPHLFLLFSFLLNQHIDEVTFHEIASYVFGYLKGFYQHYNLTLSCILCNKLQLHLRISTFFVPAGAIYLMHYQYSLFQIPEGWKRFISSLFPSCSSWMGESINNEL